MKKLFLLTVLGGIASVANAAQPTNSLLIARVSAIAYTELPSLGVYNSDQVVNGRLKANAERYGAAAGAVMKAITGASANVSKDDADRWANVRNPCSKIAGSENGNSAQFNCAVQVKYKKAGGIVTEKFNYTTIVTNNDGADDYTASVTSDFVVRSVE